MLEGHAIYPPLFCSFSSHSYLLIVQIWSSWLLMCHFYATYRKEATSRLLTFWAQSIEPKLLCFKQIKFKLILLLCLIWHKLVMGKRHISLIKLNATYKFALIRLGNCKCKACRLQKLLYRLEQHGLWNVFDITLWISWRNE